MNGRLLFPLFAAMGLTWALSAEEPKIIRMPEPNSADEPLAKELSLAQSAAFLDQVAGSWTQQRKCGACHTNYPYLMARPLLNEVAPVKDDMVRNFFEERIANWDTLKPRWDTEVVATAVTLAFHDAQTTGKLHPLTRQALDRMWTVQQANGCWNWLKCDWPPMEHDDYFGAVYAAVGLSVAPDQYTQGQSAQAGMKKLRQYLQDTPAPDLHHKTWLLWASLRLDGLMTKEQQENTIKELRKLQRADGGWSLPALGTYQRRNGTPNDANAPSDGYATGLTIYVLRQAGVPANDPAIQRGLNWLKTHQRASGRWFTRSLNTDRYHFITNAGTAFAVMALKSCAEGE
ncbi:MAG: prenyltransferase/squalene oxidase repeat-containing protein [Gemmataceae bacterium]